MKSLWFDTHCHPEMDLLADQVVEAQDSKVGGFVAVGTNLVSSYEMIDLVKEVRSKYPELLSFATVGVHPHDANEVLNGDVSRLEEIIDKEMDLVVGVGECGLDFYYDNSPRDIQKQVFEAQIELANQRDLTLVVHTRDAWRETFEILDSTGWPQRTIFHCFVGDRSDAKTAIENGAFVSFSGILTFKGAEELREVALEVPLERVLIETDAPYLTPVPLRGRANTFAKVSIVGEYLAKLKNMAVEEVSRTTWSNACLAFGLDPQSR